MIKKTDVIDVLQTCFDPEIPIDLWNLGLIYNIEIKLIRNKTDRRRPEASGCEGLLILYYTILYLSLIHI